MLTTALGRINIIENGLMDKMEKGSDITKLTWFR